ncbi:MAG: ArdC-like ssDNA-binding domain-containing protein [Thermomicrobiales bacterium]
MAPAEADTPAAAMLPRDAAKALIRPSVLRGDPLETLMGSLMGSAGADFDAQIGGSIVGDGARRRARRRVRRDQIGVSRVGGAPVSAVFSLAELYREIRAEAEANPEAAGAEDADASRVRKPALGYPVERPQGQFHTLTSSSRRLGAGDFWPEYLHEVATRERLDLPDVSPDEFEDMRDWTDGSLAPADTAWPPEPERPPSVRSTPEEWREGEDGDDDAETWADAPRGAEARAKAETVFDARQARLDATIAVLTKKVEEIVTGEGYRAYLTMLARFHTYSANNVALILAQYPDATKVMGYGNKPGTTGWKSLGRYVREGEKGIRIIRPMHATIRDEEDDTAEPMKVLRGFTTATVFDIRQTEGKPLPHEPLPADLTADEAERSLELSVHLHRFIDAAGVRVVRDHTSTHRGAWNPDKREIGLRADLIGVQALKTLAHETAHMLADHRRDGVAMADAETVAESVAFVVLDHAGIDTSAYSVPYIAGWARDPAVVSRNLDTVRTLSHILLMAFGDDCPPEAGGDGEEVTRP